MGVYSSHDGMCAHVSEVCQEERGALSAEDSLALADVSLQFLADIICDKIAFRFLSSPTD
jgi:hypothetical protein